MLLLKGADIHALDNIGQTPLHWAARANNLKIVKLLLSKGADISARDDDGRTPLYSATDRMNINIGIIKLLISRGADVNAKGNDGITPLKNAIKRVSRDDITELSKAVYNIPGYSISLDIIYKDFFSKRMPKEFPEYDFKADIAIRKKQAQIIKTWYEKNKHRLAWNKEIRKYYLKPEKNQGSKPEK